MGDSELLALLDLVERLVLENQIMRLILDVADTPVIQWKRLFRDAMHNPQSLPDIRQSFAQLRAELQHGHDPSLAIQQILQSLAALDKTEKGSY
jgi:hypothetical protein